MLATLTSPRAERGRLGRNPPSPAFGGIRTDTVEPSAGPRGVEPRSEVLETPILAIELWPYVSDFSSLSEIVT